MVAYIFEPVNRQAKVLRGCSKAFSSSVVRRPHSSMKFGRDTDTACFPGASVGMNDGSYGSDGSQRTP